MAQRTDRAASPAFRQNSERGIEMDITGIAKSHQADIHKAGKASSKLSESLREQIAEYAREDAAQGIYMGNKFLALRKSEVAKAAPDRAGIPSSSVRGGEGRYGIWPGRLTGIFAWRQ